MAIPTGDRKTDLEQQKLDLQAIITELIASILKGAKSSYISNYELDTGAGKQKVTYRNLAEMQRGLTLFQSELNRICSILGGTGVVDFALKRHGIGISGNGVNDRTP